MALRWLRWFAVGAVLTHGAAACVGVGTDDTGLNPQPLPPGEEDDRGPVEADPVVGGGSSSSGSASSPERQADAGDGDAGADGDATGGDL